MHKKQISRKGCDHEVGNNIAEIVRKCTVISRNYIYMKIGANDHIEKKIHFCNKNNYFLLQK